MSAVKKYTFAEVKEHNKPTDLWVVIHDKVYDVTKFLHEVSRSSYCYHLDEGHSVLIFFFFALNVQHPGGEEVLEEAAGKNATKDFDDADHSESAK